MSIGGSASSAIPGAWRRRGPAHVHGGAPLAEDRVGEHVESADLDQEGGVPDGGEAELAALGARIGRCRARRAVRPAAAPAGRTDRAARAPHIQRRNPPNPCGALPGQGFRNPPRSRWCAGRSSLIARHVGGVRRGRVDCGIT